MIMEGKYGWMMYNSSVLVRLGTMSDRMHIPLTFFMHTLVHSSTSDLTILKKL